MGYGSFPSNPDVEPLRLNSEGRRIKWTLVVALSMVMLSTTAVVVAARTMNSTALTQTLRSVDVMAEHHDGPSPRGPPTRRDDPTYSAAKDAESKEPHHKGNGPATLYFHNEHDLRMKDDEQYIASLAAQGAEIEDTEGTRTATVNDHEAIVAHRHKQDQDGSFHSVVPASLASAPKFDDTANIMDVLKQYEVQVNSASGHLQKLSHSEQTNAAAWKGNEESLERMQQKYDGEFEGMRKEVDSLATKLDGVETKLDQNNKVMSKLETVMEDVYYEAHDDHSKIKKVENDELEQKYKAPPAWKKPKTATTNNKDDEDEDAYYYSADGVTSP